MDLEEKQNIDNDEIFEGEETLDYEILEKIEGEQYQSIVSNHIYPDATVNIAKDPISAFQLKRKFDKEPPLLKLDPDFQRNNVWESKQKSELIESIIMGIPLPIIYVKEDKNGVYIIVDGRQRLTAIFDFMENRYKLQNLKILPKFNGSYFKNLDNIQQNKIEDCPLMLHVIKPPTSDRVTFDLFDRVNRGGTRLNNQEMRNALYQGKATKLLKELAKDEYFKKATDFSISSKRMKDRYLILRFIAFYLWRKDLLIEINSDDKVEYKSDMEDFLSKTMEFLNHTKSELLINKLQYVFSNTMRISFEIFGKDCFRLPQKDGKQRRPVNMALFETLSYFICEIEDNIHARKEIIKQEYEELSTNKDYVNSLTYSVDSNLSIKTRFEFIDNTIEGIKNVN